MRRRGLLIVLSGPAGSGKSTLAEDLVSRGEDICRAITATTRLPRGHETHGKDYLFLSREDFAEGLAEGRFVEHNEFNDCFYGTPRDILDGHLAEGKVVILVIDVNGSMEVRKAYPHSVHIFLLPPTPEDLRSRLRGRGTECVSDIERRLAIAESEIRCVERYNFLVINDDRAAAVADLLAIIEVLRPHHVRGGEADAWAKRAYSGWHNRGRTPADA